METVLFAAPDEPEQNINSIEGVQTFGVTVYSKPSCVQCDATYRALDKKGINYNVVDLVESKEALDFVHKLGYLQAPVVVAGDEHWSGFRPDQIAMLAEKIQAQQTISGATGATAIYLMQNPETGFASA